MSYLDDNFTALAPGATTRCTATNANAIVLTPISNQPAVSAYNSMQNFAFLAVANSTASVTVQVIGSGGALVAKKLYKDAAGTLQAGSGDLASGQLYVVSYIPAYDSGNGAFIIAYPTTLSISTAGFVQKSGDTMTGALVLAADPTAALQAATKQYVDTVATGSLSGQVSVQSLVEQFSALGNVSGTVTLPLGTYTNFTMTCTGTTTLAVSGAPASRMVPIVLQITNGGAYTFNWPSGSKFPGGTTLSLTAAGIDVVVGYTIDAGTTIRWMMAQKDSK
jgi:hypothetical protein